MQSWYDTSKETDEAKGISVSGGQRGEQRQSGFIRSRFEETSQCCQYLKRILWRQYWSLRGTTKIPSLLQQENESINRSPTSDALRVSLIGKKHTHKTTQENVKLGEVVEVPTENIRGSHVRESANESILKHIAGAGQLHNQISPVVTMFLVQWETSTAPQEHCPAMGKICGKCGITGHFGRVCRDGKQQDRQQQSNYVSEGINEEAFFTECDTTAQFARTGRSTPQVSFW